MDRRLKVAIPFALFPTVTVIGADFLIDLILMSIKATYLSVWRASMSNEYTCWEWAIALHGRYESRMHSKQMPACLCVAYHYMHLHSMWHIHTPPYSYTGSTPPYWTCPCVLSYLFDTCIQMPPPIWHFHTCSPTTLRCLFMLPHTHLMCPFILMYLTHD